MKIVDDYTLVAGKAKVKAVWIVAGTYEMDEDGWVVYPTWTNAASRLHRWWGSRSERSVTCARW